MVGGLQTLLAQPLPAASPAASPVSQQAHTPQKEVDPAAAHAGARSPAMPVTQTPRPAGSGHPHTPPHATAQPPGPKPAPSQAQPRQQPAALGRPAPSGPQGAGPRVAVAAGGPGSSSSRAAGTRSPEPLVVLCNSDTMKAAGRAKTYWDDVAAAASTRRGPGSATVVVADKNLCPSPAGNLAKVSGILRASGAVSLALVPVVCGPSSMQLQPELYHGLPDTPFPLELVALCLARVVGRTQHEGKLDAGLPTACSVVAMFANFFKNHSSQRLAERLRDCLDLVQELPVMTFPPQHQDALLPLMRHIADGLNRVDERGKKPLPEEWENQARKLLAQDAVKAALAGCQLPLDRVQADCCGAMRAALDVARDRAAGASGPVARSGQGVKGVAEERVRYIAVAGIPRQPLVTAVSAMLGEDVANKVKAELHITLWHSSDAAKHDLRSALMAELGTEVSFEITAIDHQEGAVTAAVVKILSAPEAVLEKEYPHVTLVVGANAAAKDANLLPQRVAEGKARRIPLAEPVLLAGPILAISKG
ncbi:hypothetical protein QJQ45_018151 [Haematococcus lacustris]|nr:hypothetical protein QJQ45_018151 [Haematococcus lacustris]